MNETPNPSDGRFFKAVRRVYDFFPFAVLGGFGVGAMMIAAGYTEPGFRLVKWCALVCFFSILWGIDWILEKCGLRKDTGTYRKYVVDGSSYVVETIFPYFVIVPLMSVCMVYVGIYKVIEGEFIDGEFVDGVFLSVLGLFFILGAISEYWEGIRSGGTLEEANENLDYWIGDRTKTDKPPPDGS